MLRYVRLFLQQEFNQYRHDVNLLMEEKTELGERFLNLLIGVLIDDRISWKDHIPFICSRASRSSGIFLKLRH